MKRQRKQSNEITLMDDIIRSLNKVRVKTRYVKLNVSINNNIKDIYIPMNLTKTKEKRIFLKNHILTFFVAECISILKLNKRNYKYATLSTEIFNSSIIEKEE